MKSTKYPAAFSGCGRTFGWYVFKFFEFFGRVILRYLMVVGTPRPRHWPARFRTRLPRISTFNTVCNSLSDVGSFVLRNTSQLPIHHSPETSPVSVHISKRARRSATSAETSKRFSRRRPHPVHYPAQEFEPNYPMTSVPVRRGHVFPLSTLSLRCRRMMCTNRPRRVSQNFGSIPFCHCLRRKRRFHTLVGISEMKGEIGFLYFL
jgi:hypothetical protein